MPDQPEKRGADRGVQSPAGARADYRSLVAELIDPVVIVNRLGRIGFMNPAAHQWLKNGLAVRLEQYLNTDPGKRGNGKVRFKLDDGTSITLEVARRDITWAGKPAVLVALHDISRHVRATQRTRNAHLRKLSLLGDVSVATYVVALDDGSVPPFLSRQFEDLLGRPRESWRENAELWRQFIHDEDYERVVQDLTQAIKNQQPFEAEYRMTTDSGEVIRVREEARVQKDKATNQSFLIGFLVDVTNETQTKEQLTAARAELAEIKARHSQELAKAREQVQRELTEARRAVEKLSAERTGLESRLSESAAEAVKMAEQLQNQTSQREQAKKESLSLRRKLDETHQATAEVRATVDSLTKQLGERSGEVLKTSRQLEQEASRRNQLERENAALTLQIGAARQTAERLKGEHRRLETELAERSVELQKILRQRECEISEHRQEQDKAEQSRQQLVEARRQVEALQAERRPLEKQLKERSAELRKTTDGVSRQASDLKQEQDKNERLRQQIAKAKGQVEALQAERRPLEKQLKERSAELQKATDWVSRQTSELKQEQSKNEPFRRDLADLKRQVEALQAERKPLEKRLEGQSAELRKAEEQAKQQIAEIQRRQSENEQLQREVAETKRQTERFRTGRDHLEMQLSERAAELVTIEARLLDQKHLRDRAEQESKKLRRELDAAKETEQKLAAHQDRLEKWAKASAAQLANAAQQLHDLTVSTGAGEGQSGAGA